MKNIDLYCLANRQNNQVMIAKNFDDTNILKLLFEILKSYDYTNQTSLTSIRINKNFILYKYVEVDEM